MLPSHHHTLSVAATAAPLLPKVRGQFAEFLDRGSLAHLRSRLRAYRCRFAVRAERHLARGFSRRPGSTSLPSPCGDSCGGSDLHVRGICLPHVLPHRSLASPVARLTLLTASPLRSCIDALGCRNLLPAFHRLRRAVLGLGPD
jgi:hypothetical protein